MKVVAILLLILLALVVVGWVGLQIKPRPFAPVARPEQPTQMVPLPAGLPAPVDRFYRRLYGDEVPLVDSAVISGRARLRVQGITFPARFRFIHEAGQGYRHYIETTFFGLPIMKVHETYLDGVGRMELPFGVTEDDPQVNQGANLGLWGEALWFPSVYVTDPRVRWEPLDETTAVLVVPYGASEERFVVRFDPETGMPDLLEAMRYKAAENETKTLWLDETEAWQEVDGRVVFTVARITWFDEGTPWAIFNVEEVAYNVDVQEYIRARGP